MILDLYYTPGSPPCSAVRMTAEIFGIKLNLKMIDFEKEGHLSPNFTKMNPAHTVPTLDDNGFIMHESRAIMTYMADQYGKNDSLYPKDIIKRATVDQKLCYDICLYEYLAAYYFPVYFGSSVDYNSDNKKKIDARFNVLETFLGQTKYIAGDTLTVADISLSTTVATFEAFGYDIKKFNNLCRWYQNIKSSVPAFKICEQDAKILKEYIANLKK